MDDNQPVPPGPMLPRPPRVFPAAKLLSGELTVEGYPFRYIAVSSIGVGPAVNEQFDAVLTAVEFLETRGWSLVNVAVTDEIRGVNATMRRF